MMIKTERLELRPLMMEYLQSTHEYASNKSITRYMVFLPNEALSETEAFIRNAEAEWAKPEPSYWEFAILLDGVHIGGASLFRLERPGEGEMGWILNPRWWGNGYATEAARGLMKHAREQWGFRRLIAQCDGENAASAHVMERLGMRLVSRTGGRKNRSSDEEREELTYAIVLE